MIVAHLAAASSFTTPWWLTSVFLSRAAIVIALAAAVFAGFQAWTAHRARRVAEDSTMVRWSAGAEWSAPTVVEVRSNGPDTARKVWARLIVNGAAYVDQRRRVRNGETVRFVLPSLATEWDSFAARAPIGNEDANEVIAFEWSVIIRWRGKYRAADPWEWSGYVTRRVRWPGPQVFDAEAHAPGMPM